MDIKELQRNWNEFGKTDPLWAILTLPDKEGRRWDINAFFETGAETIDLIFNKCESSGINIAKGKALDFGCGVGRLTQPLNKYFDEVYGVDIAPSMIELAKKYNRYSDKCKYILSDTDDLGLFPDNKFDFIISLITLQHIEPRYSKNYIKEFLRILASNGILIFQLQSEPIQNRPNRTAREKIKHILPIQLVNLYRKINCKIKRKNQPMMEMYWIKQEDVIRLLHESGGEIISIIDVKDVIAVKEKKWVNFIYIITKK